MLFLFDSSALKDCFELQVVFCIFSFSFAKCFAWYFQFKFFLIFECKIRRGDFMASFKTEKMHLILF